MVLGDDIVGGLHIGDDDIPVLDFDSEFPLQCLMHLDGSVHV